MPGNVIYPKRAWNSNKKSFAEVLTGSCSNRDREGGEACKSVYYNSSIEDRRKYEIAKVGLMKEPGSAYSVGRRLLEEGIFTIQVIPLGPNLCLMEESIEGELDMLLKEGSDWRSKWFKEVRGWKTIDTECTRAAKISIFGVPCYVRNRKLFEMLLTDIRVCPNLDYLPSNPARLDVTYLMIFTSHLKMIRSKVKVCLDGKWCDILIVDELMVTMEDQEQNFKDEDASSILGSYSSADLEEMD